MKKLFMFLLTAIGGLFTLSVAVVLLSFVLTAINENNGKSIIGKTETVNGTVSGIYDTGGFDIGFRLKGDKRHYYINRGQEKGLSVAELREQYLNKQLAISYVKQPTIFNLKADGGGHINRVKHGDLIVYTELKE